MGTIVALLLQFQHLNTLHNLTHIPVAHSISDLCYICCRTCFGVLLLHLSSVTSVTSDIYSHLLVTYSMDYIQYYYVVHQVLVWHRLVSVSFFHCSALTVCDRRVSE